MGHKIATTKKIIKRLMHYRLLLFEWMINSRNGGNITLEDYDDNNNNNNNNLKKIISGIRGISFVISSP